MVVRKISSFALGTLALFAVACGGSGSGGSGSDGGGGGGGDGGGGGGCDSASDCSGTEVCNPQTNECDGDLSCTEHGDCGPGGFCPDGTCQENETGGPCDDDANCTGGDTCIGGFCGCEGAAFAAEPVTPNMMIVLDKSGSMVQDLEGDCAMLDNDDDCTYPPYEGNESPNPDWDAPAKWTVASDAMGAILTSHGDRVRFGLVTFASDSNCGAGNVRVDIGNDTEAMIQTTIDGTSPRGSTPIGRTLDDLVGHSTLADNTRPNYVLLVTDGQEMCGGSPVAAARDLFEQSPSVRTFVVGFGGGVSASTLNNMAEEGGTARPGTTKYYQADDAAELATALDAILGSVLSCTYQLDQVPEDVEQLYVYADGAQVGRDTSRTEGWDYDPETNTVTFYGQICQDLQDGTIADVAIVYGCPGPIVE
jgi:hypothetical protein